jgi:alkylated DNA nucleotide flippase Atl1
MPGSTGFDKDLAHRVTRHLRPGEWSTYGAIAALSGTREQGYGSHVKTCAEPDTAEHRVLLHGGVPADGFRWVAEPWRNGIQTQRDVLEEEGLGFPNGSADPGCEVTVGELQARLADSGPPLDQPGTGRGPEPWALAVQVPLEQVRMPGYTAQPVSSTDALRLREEATLVHDLAAWVADRHGEVLTRWALPTGEGGPPLLTDAFLPSHRLLIEAKAGAGREYVRMALGQLLDYRRYVPAPAPGLAVLLPVAPSRDMAALLAEHAVGVIHRHGEGFAGDGLPG